MEPVPELPKTRQIALEDRLWLNDLFNRERQVASECNFANIYLWRHKYGFKVAVLDDGIIIIAEDQGFILPPIGVSNFVESSKKAFELTGCKTMCRVAEEKARKLYIDGFDIELDRDNSDYVYLARDLAELSGRKYHKKRNQIAKYEGRITFERVTPKTVPNCIRIQKLWCEFRDCFMPENRDLAAEHEAVEEALSLLNELELIAGAVRLDGEIAAFAIGGSLNSDTCVVHFEKANPSLQGMYQVLNQQFAIDMAQSYKYINREQDLGDPGLRQSKESYFSDHMINKYVVSI